MRINITKILGACYKTRGLSLDFSITSNVFWQLQIFQYIEDYRNSALTQTFLNKTAFLFIEEKTAIFAAFSYMKNG